MADTKRTRAIVESSAGTFPQKWQEQISRLLGKFQYEGTHHVLVDFMAEAERLFMAEVAEVAQDGGGVCGPVEMAALSGAAKMHALGMFLLSRGTMHPEPDGREARKLYQHGMRLVDAARCSSMAAKAAAQTTARLRPTAPGDPLARYMTGGSDDSEGSQ